MSIAHTRRRECYSPQCPAARSALATVQLHDMPADEPAEHSKSHLVTCRQRAAGIDEQICHQMAA